MAVKKPKSSVHSQPQWRAEKFANPCLLQNHLFLQFKWDFNTDKSFKEKTAAVTTSYCTENRTECALSRHMKKHLPLQLNSRPIRPGFRSALQWTVFRSANTKIFRLNPTLFLVTFEIKLGLGLLNQVDILAWAPPAIWKNTCHCS